MDIEGGKHVSPRSISISGRREVGTGLTRSGKTNLARTSVTSNQERRHEGNRTSPRDRGQGRGNYLLNLSDVDRVSITGFHNESTIWCHALYVARELASQPLRNVRM